MRVQCWRSKLPRFVISIALLLVALPGRGADYSTTNSDRLVHFWAAAESSNRPVTVLSFGDSMADSYRSPSYHLMNKLAVRCGTAGYSLNNYRNTSLWNVTNGARQRLPDAIWFAAYFEVPAGGALWWENLPNPTGVLCDSAGLFFVSQSNGGPFRLLISTNGGPWTTALGLDGFSTTPRGHFTNVVLPLNRYRLRVETDAGTNFVIGTSLVARHTNGLHAAFLDWPGIGLGQVTNVPLAIRRPILAGLRPDLLIWHMKEEVGLATSNRLEECESWWSEAAPECDALYIGSTWVSVDNTSTYTLDQNALVRSIALKHHRAYADLMLPTTNYNWLISQGFMADGTHLNTAGGLYCANLMWDDIGFFALKLNRTLFLTSDGNEAQLSYQTTTGAVYRLEASTNLQNWLPLLTNPPFDAVFATNLPTTLDRAFYRLGLRPR